MSLPLHHIPDLGENTLFFWSHVWFADWYQAQNNQVHPWRIQLVDLLLKPIHRNVFRLMVCTWVRLDKVQLHGGGGGCQTSLSCAHVGILDCPYLTPLHGSASISPTIANSIPLNIETLLTTNTPFSLQDRH